MDIKGIGVFLIVIGLAAIGLEFVQKVPSILVWIYNWGDTVAWMIKIGIVTTGALLLGISWYKENK